jgi:hypothetical protein
MNAGDGEQQETEGQRPRFFNLTLLAIVLLSLVPRLLLATSQYVEYDGYWHVWIAQQDRWANFIREYQTNAHPPLYFILLRLSFLFGRTQLVYRSVSLIAGAASVWMLGRTALRATLSPLWAALAALTYGLAMPSILVSNEVRTYMLAAFLVQVSFYYFLDLIAERQPASLRPRVLFAVTATLACLSEYYALIYVGAALLVALALPILRRETRSISATAREIVTFALILALPVWEYISHLGARSVAYDHLPDYYFRPNAAESAVAFLWRNLRNEMNWFSPWAVPDGPAFCAVVAILLATATVTVYLLRKASTPKDLAALASLLFPTIILAAIMTGGLVRAYPFGGFLRQQYILFPFVVVCPFLFVDRLLESAPPMVTRTLAGLVAIVVTLVSIQNYQVWPKDSGLLLTEQMSRYNRMFPAAEGVYIDQFNLITFFTHHHNWNWVFVSPLPGSTTVDVYRLSGDRRSMLLFRDLDHWLLDLREPDLYTLMSRGMHTFHLSSMTIFCPAQFPGKPRTQLQETAYRTRIAELSAAQGLCVQTLELENYDVYAEFRPGGCTVQ